MVIKLIVNYTSLLFKKREVGTYRIGSLFAHSEVESGLGQVAHDGELNQRSKHKQQTCKQVHLDSLEKNRRKIDNFTFNNTYYYDKLRPHNAKFSEKRAECSFFCKFGTMRLPSFL